MKPTTAAYLRVSSRLSTGRQKTDSQETALRSYCRTHGIKPLWYIDHSTGRNLKRPGLQRLLADCKSGRVNHILCCDLSRLSRSVRDALSLIEMLTQQSVSLTITNQHLTFDRGAMSQFMLAVFAALAQLESDIRSERVKNGLQTRRDKGLPVGRQRDNAKRQQVADLRAKGVPVRQIATRLKVSRQSIYRLLTA